MGDDPDPCGHEFTDPGHIPDPKFFHPGSASNNFSPSDPRCLFWIMNFDLDLWVKGTGSRMGIRNTFRNSLDHFPRAWNHIFWGWILLFWSGSIVSVFDPGSVRKNSDPGIGVNMPDLSVADTRCLSRILIFVLPGSKNVKGAKILLSLSL